MQYELETFGSFHIGGKKISVANLPPQTVTRGLDFPSMVINPNGDYWVEQAYVQYFIPKKIQYEEAIILVHGGGHTGAVWENTPDGRPGWLHYFLSEGRKVYVIDNVERGRAGWCSLKNIWPQEPELRSAQQSWQAFRIGEPNAYASRTPFVGQQFPVQFFDQFIQHTVPRWHHNNKGSTQNIVKLINKVGKSILITHSQSGPFGLNAALACPKLVSAVILLEPVGVTIHDADKLKKNKFLFLFADNINEYWQTHRQRAFHTATKLREVDADVHWLDLPKIGIFGNSHQVMMDNNNLEIAQIVDAWLKNEINYEL